MLWVDPSYFFLNFISLFREMPNLIHKTLISVTASYWGFLKHCKIWLCLPEGQPHPVVCKPAFLSWQGDGVPAPWYSPKWWIAATADLLTVHEQEKRSQYLICATVSSYLLWKIKYVWIKAVILWKNLRQLGINILVLWNHMDAEPALGACNRIIVQM